MIKNQCEFEIIKSLIGQDVTAENLKCVDMYISKNVGIFIPSIGFCEYAIKPHHSHPSYSFVILFDKNSNFIKNVIDIPFNRLFKKEMSISPIEYLIKLRLNKSKKYLRETDYSITDISLKCGFYSASHFSSYFLKQFGLSPSEYHKIFTTN